MRMRLGYERPWIPPLDLARVPTYEAAYEPGSDAEVGPWLEI